MSNPDLHLFSFKFKMFFINLSDYSIINITINSPQRFESGKLISSFNITDIAGMPDLIAYCKMVKEPGMDPAMGI